MSLFAKFTSEEWRIDQEIKREIAKLFDGPSPMSSERINNLSNRRVALMSRISTGKIKGEA